MSNKFAVHVLAGREVYIFEGKFNDRYPSQCYSYRLAVYSNGKCTHKGNLSLFFCPQPGPNPDALKWPIERTIRFTVINTKDSQKNVTEKLSPPTSDGSKQFFAEHAPPVEGNTSALGFGQFLSKKQIESGEFISSNGTLVVQVELGPKVEECRVTRMPPIMNQPDPTLWENRKVARETPVQKNNDTVSLKENPGDPDASCWQDCTSPDNNNVGSHARDVVRGPGELCKYVIMRRPYIPRGERFAKERTPYAGRVCYSAFSGPRCRVQYHNGKIEDVSVLYSLYHDHPPSNLHLQQNGHHIDDSMLVARHRRSETAGLLLDEALIEHAIYLGMDPKTDKEHFHIARRSLEAELPEPWQQGITEEGDPYYYNTETEESVWKHPMEKFYREMFATAKASELNASKLPLSSRCPTFE